LRIDSPNIWQSLLSFNVSVEIGQLAIVLAFWPTLLLLEKVSVRSWHTTRLAIAFACIGIAGYWTVERIPAVFETL